MQVVIDIPKDLYKSIICHRCKIEFQQKCDYENLKKAIENGTPLPKEHGKLITEPTEKEITETIGGKNDFADCIREAVKTVFANATPIIEEDKEG